MLWLPRSSSARLHPLSPPGVIVVVLYFVTQFSESLRRCARRREAPRAAAAAHVGPDLERFHAPAVPAVKYGNDALVVGGQNKRMQKHMR